MNKPELNGSTALFAEALRGQVNGTSKKVRPHPRPASKPMRIFALFLLPVVVLGGTAYAHSMKDGDAHYGRHSDWVSEFYSLLMDMDPSHVVRVCGKGVAICDPDDAKWHYCSETEEGKAYSGVEAGCAFYEAVTGTSTSK